MNTITGDDIQEMVRHWLETPVNAYLGSGYGSDTKSLLQRAQSNDGMADDYLRKLRKDVGVLDVLPEGTVALYGEPSGHDQLRITIEVAGRSYELNDIEGSR